MDEETIIDIWHIMKDFVPVKQREEAAFQFMQLLEDSGEEINLLTGHDAYLDKVIAEIVGEPDEEDLELEEY